MQAEALASGTRLGRYEIVRPLGRGGAGAVFLARAPGPEGFERTFAVKVLHPTAGARAALVEEAKLLQGLHHSNVVQVFELGREGELDFVAMEYVDGMSLEDVIRRTPVGKTPLPLPICLYIGAEMCKALHFVHGRTDANGRPLGLVHRDISPSNVLLSFAGEVKLADFGIAKGSDVKDRPMGATEPGIVKGKLGYMAPEQAAGGVALDGRVDLFGTALSIYEAMVGENPLIAETELDTYHRCLDPQITAPSRLLPGIAKEVDAFFERALAKVRDQRFATAADMRRAIDELPPMRGFATPDLALAAELGRVRALPAPSVRSLSGAARAALGGAGAAARVTSEVQPGGATAASDPETAAKTALVPRPARSRTGARLVAGLLGPLAVLGVGIYLASSGSAPAPAPAPTIAVAPPPPPAPSPASSPVAPSPSPSPSTAPPVAPSPSPTTVARRPGRTPRAPAAPGGEASPPPAVAPGTLRVNVDPWAEVVLDGKVLGNVPKSASVPAGRHTLVLRNPGLHLEKTLVVSVEPGETKTVTEWPP